MCGMSTDKIFTAALIFFCSALSFFIFMLSSVSSGAHYVPIEIAGGSGFNDIADILVNKGIIRSKNAFKVYGVISGSAHQLKPGNYLLSSGSSTPVIVGQKGDQLLMFLLLFRRATLKDIDEILSDAEIIKKIHWRFIG